MSPFGPYRYGYSGVEYIGKPIEDKTIGANGGTSLRLGGTNVLAHSCWVPLRRQLWFWMATGASNDPDTLGCFSIGRLAPFYGGYNTESETKDSWSLFTGGIATARCSSLFANTLGATMSHDLYPYIGSTSAAKTLGKADTGTQDFGASYQAYLTTKSYKPWGDGYAGSMMGAQLTAKAASAVTIQLSTVSDFGVQTAVDTVLLTAAGSETRVQPRFGGAVAVSGIQAVQFTIGDSAAANTAWQLDSLIVSWKREAAVVA